MQDLILSEIELWIEGKEEEFIITLSKKFVLKSRVVSKRFQERIDPLSKEQLSDSHFKFLLVLSEMIKEIHEKAVNGIIKEIKNEFNLKYTDKIDSILQALSEQNDLDFSLMLNLAVLREYALITKESFPAKIFTKYYQIVLTNIKSKIKTRK